MLENSTVERLDNPDYFVRFFNVIWGQRQKQSVYE